MIKILNKFFSTIGEFVLNLGKKKEPTERKINVDRINEHYSPSLKVPTFKTFIGEEEPRMNIYSHGNIDLSYYRRTSDNLSSIDIEKFKSLSKKQFARFKELNGIAPSVTMASILTGQYSVKKSLYFLKDGEK